MSHITTTIATRSISLFDHVERNCQITRPIIHWRLIRQRARIKRALGTSAEWNRWFIHQKDRWARD